MSIFSKQIQNLEYQDIRELLVEGAEEDIRLEFKRDYPGKSNMIKKISAFANTYGGYIILGIEEDGRGKIKSLPGIDLIKRLDQSIVQWCFEEIYPPIVPFVSPPIPHKDHPDKFFYVIYIEQSMETPHILNKSRNGLYVRTDEYSQKFLTRLAKFDELEYLMDKRRKAENLQHELIERASRRLQKHRELRFDEHYGADSLLKLCLIPLFPGNRIFKNSNLIRYARESAIPSRQKKMPDFSGKHVHSHFETIISEKPGVSYYSYFEINIYNMLFYVCNVTREYETSKGEPVIPLKVMMAEIMLFLAFARNFYKKSGFDGLLKLTAGMQNIRGREIIYSGQDPNRQIACYLDDSLSMTKIYSNRDLAKYKDISRDLFKDLCFALGYRDIYNVPTLKMEKFFREGQKYLGWGEE
ncbi:MAG: ATP-binding protein [Firmicutes bacterium]|nr:ATP-binding protein [Bacillota bacterium]